MQVYVLAHQVNQLPILLSKQVLASHPDSQIKRFLVMSNINRWLKVGPDAHKEEVAELINVDCVIRHSLVDAIEKVIEDLVERLKQAFLLLVLKMLHEKVAHDAPQLRLTHGAEIKIEEHVLIKHVCVLLENLNLLDLAIVHYDH